MFDKIVSLKYEGKMFNILDVLKFGDVEIATLNNDHFAVKAGENLFFVKEFARVNLDETGLEEVTRHRGINSYGYVTSLTVERLLRSKNCHILKLEQNGHDINLEGQRIFSSDLTLF